jgi:hypothetical protein
MSKKSHPLTGSNRKIYVRKGLHNHVAGVIRSYDSARGHLDHPLPE